MGLPLVLLALNLLIVAKEFRVQYTAYLLSNEGSFIALARSLAAHPGDFLWWPSWDLGLPFQNTYIPGLQIVVAAFIRLTGHPASLSFHQVSGLFFALGPVAMYLMAWVMTRLPVTSFLAALGYSILSPSAWLIPEERVDLASLWNLRRLQIFAFYGEGPHTASLCLLPLAILFLYLAMTRGAMWMKVAAGFFLGATVLMNAFGATLAGMAALALIAANPGKRSWRNVLLLVTIALLAYLWISPLLPPSVVSDIRRNSPRVAGASPFNAVSALGLGDTVFAFLFLWLWTRNKLTAPLRFFLFYTLTVSAVVLLAAYADSNLIPQPSRYSTAMDMALWITGVFCASAFVRKHARPLARSLVVVLVLAAAVQARHTVRFARGMIQNTDVTKTTTYHVAEWMDEHMHGERVFVGGSHSFHMNAFTETPQLHGGHDPMEPSMLTLIGGFVIASGMNTGSRDVEICTTWLKALGAHAISVPGPISDSYYKPFVNPLKFEGHLPVAWREGDTTIYRVPTRSDSLAHVVPAVALVKHLPVNGLDVDELTRYVAAMENPALPEASFRWLNRHSAQIEAKLRPGQVISIQERYAPGWEAVVNGRPRAVERDGLGFMYLAADCSTCTATIRYDGGIEWRATCLASFLVTVWSLVALWRSISKREQSR